MQPFVANRELLVHAVVLSGRIKILRLTLECSVSLECTGCLCFVVNTTNTDNTYFSCGHYSVYSVTSGRITLQAVCSPTMPTPARVPATAASALIAVLLLPSDVRLRPPASGTVGKHWSTLHFLTL